MDATARMLQVRARLSCKVKGEHLCVIVHNCARKGGSNDALCL